MLFDSRAQSRSRPRRSACVAVLLCAHMLRVAFAAPPGPPAPPASPTLDVAQRAEVLRTLAAKLTANYVFPDVAAHVNAALPEKTAAYAADGTALAFAERLSADLRTLADDRHFRVFVDPSFHEPASPNAVPSADELANQRVEVAQAGFGIETVQRLPGNVGYIELRGFGPTEGIAAAYAAAIALLDGSEALILDLRRNGGGEPNSVALWLSHFFAVGDQRHLNDIYTRSTDSTQQYWTSPSAGPRYTKPVYVLTSARTFSAGEECAYDFQTQKRALLVGEVTGGGANAGDRFTLGHGLVVNIPTARAINPVTHTNWEHTGVTPDIAVSAAQAKQAAYVAILRSLAASTSDARQTTRLKQLLALAEKGEIESPVYTMRR